MVVASDYFKESDSVRDYTQLKKDVENAGKQAAGYRRFWGNGADRL